MGYEVEVKYRVTDLSALADRLIAIGAVGGGSSDHADHYLAHPGRDFGQTDEALRIRRIGNENRVTYKGPKRPGPTKTREELEIPFEPGTSAFESMNQLFNRIGFRPVAVVAKSRRDYLINRGGRELAVTIDDAADLGTFAEVETLANNEADLPQAQSAVMGLAVELGLSEVEPRSYLRMRIEASA